MNPNSASLDTALQFAGTLTADDEQETMVSTLRWIPANITANQTIADDTMLSTIAEVMQTGIVINSDTAAMLAQISAAIDRGLASEQAIDVVAQDLVQALNSVEETE